MRIEREKEAKHDIRMQRFRECPCKMRIERTYASSSPGWGYCVSESVLVKWGLKVLVMWSCPCLRHVSESVLVKWGLKESARALRIPRAFCFRECPCKMRIESAWVAGSRGRFQDVSESVLVKWGLKASLSISRMLPAFWVSESVLVKWGLKGDLGRRGGGGGSVSESVLVKWGLKDKITKNKG